MKYLIVLAIFLSMMPALASGQHRPDIIVVVTDDMMTSDWQALPQTQALLADGTWLTNYIIVTPLCCPSRASMLSGLYPHNTEVLDNSNDGRSGGWKAFKDNEPAALPAQLPDYDTALIGKYLNGYEGTAVPGWDLFSTYEGRPGYIFHGGYSTDVQRDEAVAFLSDGDPDPKFLWFAPYAPHNPATYAQRHEGAFPDKTGQERDRLRSLLAVDEAVAAMYAAADPDTVWIVVSDNGYDLAIDGKNTPHDWVTRVAALVRIPGLPAGEDTRITANIDVFATVLTAAGYPVPGNDGRAWQDAWQRDGILIEGWEGRTNPANYKGIWTPVATFVDWGTEGRKLWQDPDQAQNSFGASDKQSWNNWLDEFRGCAGDVCRAADGG